MLTWPTPIAMKNSTTSTFAVTTMLLNSADSRVPRYSRTPIRQMMQNAGKLKMPVVSATDPPMPTIQWLCCSVGGITSPKTFFINATK